MLSQPPVWLLGLPPVVETEHDGEGAGGQQLLFGLVLLVLVIETVSCRQGKSVANLFDSDGHPTKNNIRDVGSIADLVLVLLVHLVHWNLVHFS